MRGARARAKDTCAQLVELETPLLGKTLPTSLWHVRQEQRWKHERALDEAQRQTTIPIQRALKRHHPTTASYTHRTPCAHGPASTVRLTG